MVDVAQSFKSHASELTRNIQNLSPSENPACVGIETSENGLFDAKLNSDIRKMETVSILEIFFHQFDLPN